MENQDSIQLLNTAIIKSKEKKIDGSFEDRLANTCRSVAMESLGIAVSHLSEKQKVSRDRAAIILIETIRELDNSWNDYLLMEGISIVKENLKNGLVQ